MEGIGGRAGWQGASFDPTGRMELGDAGRERGRCRQGRWPGELALDPCEQAVITVRVQKPLESHTLKFWQLPTPGPSACFVSIKMQIEAHSALAAVPQSRSSKT